MFHVTAAVEIECSEIKTIQYFQKNIKLEYLPQIKLAGGHRTHITVLIYCLKAISLCRKRKYTYN